ncbi:MAG: hypothetical protein R3E85_07640 [Planctomycetota bacterium]
MLPPGGWWLTTPELTEAQRLDLMEEIVEADGDNQLARLALDDEQIDDVWQMPEHASASQRARRAVAVA